MSNARNLANLLGTGTQVTTADIADGVFQANKNLIINGAMQVAQRGTNITTSTGYTYGIDRWSDYWGMNYLQQTATINGATANTCKFTTQSSNFILYYRIEDNITKNEVAASFYAGKTLSFWYRSNFAATSIGLFDITTVGDETWRYYTKTFTSTPAKSSEFFEFTGRTSGTDYIEMTQVQLEVGDTATPFEHRSYADELARCQRYYESIQVFTGYFTTGQAYTTSQAGGATVNFKVTKRTTPTLTVPAAGNTSGTWGFVGGNGSYATIGSHTLHSSVDFFRIEATGYSGLSAGNASMIYSNGATEAKADAEL